jgi:DNA-binding NtrC family response regulator
VISGETGSGKGAVARLIHAHSDRKARPFVHVDCAALSPTLIESELFGHVRGAFTSAEARRRGRFEVAADGTIFLDEIAELDLQGQRKLLRVLEDRCFEPVGSSSPTPMRARVLAATNRDLEALVSAGAFREDLFYRLFVTRIAVPSLRERVQDIPDLTQLGLRRLEARLPRPVPSTTDEFCERPAEHDWPGNLREFFNVLEHAVVCTSLDRLRLRAADLEGILPRRSSLPGRSLHLTAPRWSHETDSHIAETLIQTGGNVSRTARRLGLPRSTLRYRIQRDGLGHLLPKD